MTGSDFNVNIVDGRTIVSLKASPGSSEQVAERLSLSEPLKLREGDVSSMWVSPGCWLLLSDGQGADELIERCTATLADVLHLAVDYSDATAIVRVAGPSVREVLASGCALDLREANYSVGSAYRTRFAQVAAFVVATGRDDFELYVDASYRAYLVNWLGDSDAIATRCRSVARE